MTKDKSCKVCKILNSDLNFSDYINSRLKSDIKIAEIRKEFIKSNLVSPSKYYLEEHKQNCLKNFKAKIKEDDINSLRILEKLEKYRGMDSKEKLIDKVNRFNEIEFMCAVTVHHQLSYNDTTLRTTIPKENIGALKQIEDILKNIEDLEKNKPMEPPIITLNFLDKYGTVYKTKTGETVYEPHPMKVDPRDSEN